MMFRFGDDGDFRGNFGNFFEIFLRNFSGAISSVLDVSHTTDGGVLADA
jgi:hypothetical protein